MNQRLAPARKFDIIQFVDVFSRAVGLKDEAHAGLRFADTTVLSYKFKNRSLLPIIGRSRRIVRSQGASGFAQLARHWHGWRAKCIQGKIGGPCILRV